MLNWRKVIILCPGATVSGGPEALHQLAGALAECGIDASLYYYPSVTGGHTVPLAYRHYNVRVSPELSDDPSILIITCDVITSAVWRFQHAKTAIWWLSVDNYFKWKHINPGPSVLDPGLDILHLCQSEYASRFLAEYGIKSTIKLTDYITEGVFSIDSTVVRKPCVAYNPKKGVDITKLLIARSRAPLAWVPLQGMEKSDIADALRQVRVYVDFGNHPGRDRIPREAALCGAVVITGRRGAAGFVGDTPLPDRFRIDEQAPNFEDKATRIINELLQSEKAFQAAMFEQDAYRTWIRSGKDVFLSEVNVFIEALQR